MIIGYISIILVLEKCLCCFFSSVFIVCETVNHGTFVSTVIVADIQQLETHMKQREQENRDPLIGQLQQMIDNFQSSTDQLASNITANVRVEIQHQLQMMVGK